MKLWQKKYTVSDKIDRFTVGDDRIYDTILIKYDILASMAHAKMLKASGLISKKECHDLVNALNLLLKDAEQGYLEIEDCYEDMHSKLEAHLIQELGDTGKKIHTARSRNDQVLVAFQLYLRDELTTIQKQCIDLFDILITLASKHKDSLMPGYTHFQVAMPSSFGLWFSAFAELLVDDVSILANTMSINNQNPLGSAAGYGSSFPIDRTITTKELGFDTMKFNVIAAQLSRGKVEKLSVNALANIATTLSKLAMDICLYMSQNFAFISFPDSLTTGSSIMPHKKNPDVFELIRGKCNILQGLPSQLTHLTTNLPSGYHRELQLTKKIVMPALNDLQEVLDILTHALPQIIITPDIMKDPIYDNIYSVDTLNKMVLDGMSFRDAYRTLSSQIEKGTYVPNKDLKHSHQGSIGNLCLEEITKKIRPFRI